MEPQQAPAPYNSGDPYRFIMEPPKKPKAPAHLLGGFGNNPFFLKIAVLVGGALALMMVAAIIINLFFGTSAHIGTITDLVETQQEIIRVTTGNTAADQGLKNAAINAQLTLTTQQQIMLAYLQQHGRKLGGKELSSKRSATTDAQLTQAKATSTYDSTFAQIISSQLDTYAAALKDAYNNTTITKEKNMLANDYNQTQMLITQWPATITNQ